MDFVVFHQKENSSVIHILFGFSFNSFFLAEDNFCLKKTRAISPFQNYLSKLHLTSIIILIILKLNYICPLGNNQNGDKGSFLQVVPRKLAIQRSKLVGHTIYNYQIEHQVVTVPNALSALLKHDAMEHIFFPSSSTLTYITPQKSVALALSMKTEMTTRKMKLKEVL